MEEKRGDTEKSGEKKMLGTACRAEVFCVYCSFDKGGDVCVLYCGDQQQASSSIYVGK